MTTPSHPGVLSADVARHYPYGYAVIDVETSGLSAQHNRVLQIAVAQMRPDGALEQTWSTLLNPECDPGPVGRTP
jgi:DNA polymerase-3 subunit epsilon